MTNSSLGDELHSDSSSMDKPKLRAKRHSYKPYVDSTNNPQKLGFYPPQWRDVLEASQKKWRSWMAYDCAFPRKDREEHLEKAMECILEAISEHEKKGGRVEEGMTTLR